MKSSQKKYTFDYRAKTYERLNWVTDETLLKRIRKLINEFQPKNILDLGIGTGIVEVGIVKGIKVTGIDVSLKMLEACRKRHPSFELINGDIKRLIAIFPKRKFDMILSRASLGHLKIFPVLKDIKKCLLIGGKVLLCESISYSVKDIQNQIKFHNLLHPGHLDFPTENQFMAMFDNLGLSVNYRRIIYTKCDIDSLFASLDAKSEQRERVESFLFNLSREHHENWGIKVAGNKVSYRRPWLLVVAEKKDDY